MHLNTYQVSGSYQVPGTSIIYQVLTFPCIKIDWRKARERELATFDENRRAVGMLNPIRDKS